ncbi:unnamed protein product [Cuscuta europaea]|uniref:Uncharacterized protein n=1 Tax=Cuscuta europaea TaxID=41803 RepID=A0A9P0Z0X6_CUSEU|nr:unnamed protein product [Cuscuta europaea]
MDLCDPPYTINSWSL